MTTDEQVRLAFDALRAADAISVLANDLRSNLATVELATRLIQQTPSEHTRLRAICDRTERILTLFRELSALSLGLDARLALEPIYRRLNS